MMLVLGRRYSSGIILSIAISSVLNGYEDHGFFPVPI